MLNKFETLETGQKVYGGGGGGRSREGVGHQFLNLW